MDQACFRAPFSGWSAGRSRRMEGCKEEKRTSLPDVSDLGRCRTKMKSDRCRDREHILSISGKWISPQSHDLGHVWRHQLRFENQEDLKTCFTTVDTASGSACFLVITPPRRMDRRLQQATLSHGSPLSASSAFQWNIRLHYCHLLATSTSLL